MQRIGLRIVRAWFDTVVLPLIESLDLERALLKNRNWTWRFRFSELELIRPIEEYLNDKPWARIEQFEDLGKEIGAEIAIHDSAVAELLRKAGELHRALVCNREFMTLCNRTMPAESLASGGIGGFAEVFDVHTQQDRYDSIAQDVVNGSEQTRAYSTGKLGSAHRIEWLGSITLAGLEERHAAVSSAGARLMSSTEHLIRLMRELPFRFPFEDDQPDPSAVSDESTPAELLYALELRKRMLEEKIEFVRSMLNSPGTGASATGRMIEPVISRRSQGPRELRGESAVVAGKRGALAREVTKHLSFTRREDEIVRLVSQGYDNKQIGERLCIAHQTVKNHLHAIFRKARVSRRRELDLHARSDGGSAAAAMSGHV